MKKLISLVLWMLSSLMVNSALAWTFDNDFVFTGANVTESEVQAYYQEKFGRSMTTEEKDSFNLIRSFYEANVVLRGAQVNCADVSRGGQANCRRLNVKVNGLVANAEVSKKISVDPWLSNSATGNPFPQRVSCHLTASLVGEVDKASRIVFTPKRLNLSVTEEAPQDRPLCGYLSQYFLSRTQSNLLKIILINFDF